MHEPKQDCSEPIDVPENLFISRLSTERLLAAVMSKMSLGRVPLSMLPLRFSSCNIVHELIVVLVRWPTNRFCSRCKEVSADREDRAEGRLLEKPL